MSDYNTGVLVALSVLDQRESSLVSTGMELCGLIGCLYEVLWDGVDAAKICTDQHVMVSKFPASGTVAHNCHRGYAIL